MENQSEHKVLVGFKCSPELRLALCEEAEAFGVTLSSHVETIVASYKYYEKNLQATSRKVSELEKKVTFYENSFLQELFNKYKGQTIAYINKDRQKTTVVINDIEDVFTIIVNSFKIEKE